MPEILNKIKELDKSDIYGSILAFTDQVTEGFTETGKISLPPDFFNATKVVVAAMGGSALGARVVESVFATSLKVPLRIINDYPLPADADPETLIIASSYSGNTEETLSAYHQAKEAGCPIFTIAAGGKLLETARETGLPFYQIVPAFNPSNQPRMALGYPLGSLLEIFSRLKFIDIEKDEPAQICRKVKEAAENYRAENAGSEPLKVAEKLAGRIPIFVAAEHLTGSAHATRNQVNENAKNFSAIFPLPEMNHHLIEALPFPKNNKENLFFVFYESLLYHPRIQKRLSLTGELVERNGIPTHTYICRGQNKLEEALSAIQFGAFLGFYLAMINGIDPAPIPQVDWFKERMLGSRMSKFDIKR